MLPIAAGQRLRPTSGTPHGKCAASIGSRKPHRRGSPSGQAALSDMLSTVQLDLRWDGIGRPVRLIRWSRPCVDRQRRAGLVAGGRLRVLCFYPRVEVAVPRRRRTHAPRRPGPTGSCPARPLANPVVTTTRMFSDRFARAGWPIGLRPATSATTRDLRSAAVVVRAGAAMTAWTTRCAPRVMLTWTARFSGRHRCANVLPRRQASPWPKRRRCDRSSLMSIHSWVRSRHRRVAGRRDLVEVDSGRSLSAPNDPHGHPLRRRCPARHHSHPLRQGAQAKALTRALHERSVVSQRG